MKIIANIIESNLPVGNKNKKLIMWATNAQFEKIEYHHRIVVRKFFFYTGSDYKR